MGGGGVKREKETIIRNLKKAEVWVLAVDHLN